MASSLQAPSPAADSPARGPLPPLSDLALDSFEFQNWHPAFRRDTIKSRTIALPEEFVRYLNEDGIYLPDELATTQPRPKCALEEASDDEGDWSAADEEEEKKEPFFPELVAEIERTIEELGGSVFPKLNWSSPKDASWIAFDQTLRCGSVGDIILLLKSSDFVAHDLCRAYEQCALRTHQRDRPETFYLVLRKWSNLHPSREFRCFVFSERIVAVSQRNTSDWFPELRDRALVSRFREDLEEFFQANVCGKFPESHYVFDAYIDTSHRVWLVDFNPFAPMTDALLFKWEELARLCSEEAAFELRVADGSTDGGPQQPGMLGPTDMMQYRLPRDFLEREGEITTLVERLSTGDPSFS